MHVLTPFVPASDADLIHTFTSLGFVSADPCMLPILRKAWRAARVSDITLLIEGETGTGKQVIAAAIHSLDPKRSGHPFITFHCGAIPESLAEAEMFGHKRGAFSGATQERKGLFQTAHKGTLFLDDVNDLPLTLQAKLLDVLQRGKVRAVGSDQEIAPDVRIVAAANQALAPLVEGGRFRPDLFYRLDVIRITLPPLRERPRDVSALVMTFARRHAVLYPGVEYIDAGLANYLELCPFCGNVRELEHTVQRMLFAKTEGQSLTKDDWLHQTVPVSSASLESAYRDLAAAMRRIASQSEDGLEGAVRDVERRILQDVLTEGVTRKQAARELGMSERNFYRKLRAHGLVNTAKKGSELCGVGSSLKAMGKVG